MATVWLPSRSHRPYVGFPKERLKGQGPVAPPLRRRSVSLSVRLLLYVRPLWGRMKVCMRLSWSAMTGVLEGLLSETCTCCQVPGAEGGCIQSERNTGAGMSPDWVAASPGGESHPRQLVTRGTFCGGGRSVSVIH